MKETICWTCKFCTGATLPNPNYKNNNNENKFFICPWVTQYKPVLGWSATETKLKVAPKQTIDSYLVHECPYYVADLEAKIAAMTTKQIAARLEVSSAFVEKHLKLSRQILYIYTNKRFILLTFLSFDIPHNILDMFYFYNEITPHLVHFCYQYSTAVFQKHYQQYHCMLVIAIFQLYKQYVDYKI